MQVIGHDHEGPGGRPTEGVGGAKLSDQAAGAPEIPEDRQPPVGDGGDEVDSAGLRAAAFAQVAAVGLAG
jgi:hypothetical protein